MLKKLSLLFLVGLITYSCTKVPFSGRNQLSLVSNSEILPISYDQYGQVLQESKLVTSSTQGQQIVKVGRRIAEAVEIYMREKGYKDELEGFQWEFNLIDSEQVNAWCMPGGKVAFYTGIMPICKDETGIAVVMGHGVAHATASHARERMSNGLLLNGLIGGVQAAMGQNPTLTQSIFLQAVGYGGQLKMLRFSRKHELEADQLGLNFMALAGYDPRQAPFFWERMNAASEGNRPLEFLSTHPGLDKRIQELNEQMAEAMVYFEKSQKQ